MSSRLGLLLVTIALALSALPGIAVGAPSKAQGGPKITVMTRNIFLGADLGPAIEADSIPEAIDGAGEIWNEFQATKFPERAKPLAREIATNKPDLVGLQEVALWRKQALRRRLAADQPVRDACDPGRAGLPRHPDERAEERGRQLRGRNRPGRVQGRAARRRGRLGRHRHRPAGRVRRRLRREPDDARRDPGRKGTKVKLGQTAADHEDAVQPSIGGIEIPVDRGWVSVEARVGSFQFRFVNTHLEAFGSPTIREAQAKADRRTAYDVKQVVLVGDLNSGVARHNEPERLGDDLAFRRSRSSRMTDNGAVRAAATRTSSTRTTSSTTRSTTC